MDIMVIAKCMVKLFIVLVLGFGLYKADIIDAATSKKLSSLIVKVTAPLWIITSLFVLLLFSNFVKKYFSF